MIDWVELPKYKKSDIGIFLGCGISIRNITDNQWKKIKLYDTWTSNNWHYHSFVPNFYHIELKSLKDDWNNLWGKVHKRKLKQYENVKFILNKDHCDHILPRLGNMKYIFGYPKEVKMGQKSNISISFQSASTTLVIDLMCLMGYKKIIIFGMDLNTSEYFWSNTDEYGEIHDNSNRGKELNEPHTTIGVSLYFVPFVSSFRKIPIYVGYKETALYPSVPYINILEDI